MVANHFSQADVLRGAVYREFGRAERLAWQARHQRARLTRDQRRLGDVVGRLPDTDNAVCLMSAVFASVALIKDQQGATVEGTYIRIFHKLNRTDQQLLTDVFRRARVTPTAWLNIELELFRLTHPERATADSADADYLLIRRELATVQRLQRAGAQADHESWSEAFWCAFRLEKVVAPRTLQEQLSIDRQSAIEMLERASVIDIARAVQLPEEVVRNVLLGDPVTAEINAFCRSTGWMHPDYPAREMTRLPGSALAAAVTGTVAPEDRNVLQLDDYRKQLEEKILRDKRNTGRKP